MTRDDMKKALVWLKELMRDGWNKDDLILEVDYFIWVLNEGYRHGL